MVVGGTVLLVVALFGSLQAANPNIMFRLDDLQCWWMEANSRTIVETFVKHSIPITVGIITKDFLFCPLMETVKALRDANPHLIDVASHSVNHEIMTGMTYEQQLFEAQNSKAAIESFFGAGTVRLFIPPGNMWNYDTIRAVTAAGYDMISGQCAISQIGGSVKDSQCTTTMYLNRPSFFPRLDGIMHLPVGASISAFGRETDLLTVEQLFTAGISDCQSTQKCSINTQTMAMPSYTQATDGNWAHVMMHPQCWADADSASIQAYLDQVLPRAHTMYVPRLASVYMGPIGSRPNTPGQQNPRVAVNATLSK